MTAAELFRNLRTDLTPMYGEGEAAALVRMMFEYLNGWSRVDLALKAGQDVSDFKVGKFTEMEHRLLAGEPIQYITGEADFYGIRFHVSPDVLIPRPETAELVDMIVDQWGGRSDLRVLDVGTGSGCIAIALCRNLPFAQVTGIDVSPAAIEIARQNASDLRASVHFEVTDIFSYTPEPDSLDIVVSNPPYITQSEAADMEPNVLDHEPHTALFVPDTDPLLFYRRIAEVAMQGLKAGGRLYFETNRAYTTLTAEMLKAGGWVDVQTHRDSFGNLRFVTATKAKPEA